MVGLCGGINNKGYLQGGYGGQDKGGNQANRGRGQVGKKRARYSRGGGQGPDKRHCYAILYHLGVETFNIMIRGTIHVYNGMAFELFYLNSTISYVFVTFVMG